MVAVEGLGGEVDCPPQWDGIACSNAVGFVRLQPVSVVGARLRRCLVLVIKFFVFLDRGGADLRGVVCRHEAALVQNRLCTKEVVEGHLHLGGAEYVGRVIALDEGWRQKGMIAVAMGEEDVLRPQPVDNQPGVEQQVELRDDERSVPGCSRSAREDVLLVFTWEPPFEDFRMR